jgi:hypothetical protein
LQKQILANATVGKYRSICTDKSAIFVSWTTLRDDDRAGNTLRWLRRRARLSNKLANHFLLLLDFHIL